MAFETYCTALRTRTYELACVRVVDSIGCLDRIEVFSLCESE